VKCRAANPGDVCPTALGTNLLVRRCARTMQRAATIPRTLCDPAVQKRTTLPGQNPRRHKANAATQDMVRAWPPPTEEAPRCTYSQLPAYAQAVAKALIAAPTSGAHSVRSQGFRP
jgi:hypothetical protein